VPPNANPAVWILIRVTIVITIALNQRAYAVRKEMLHAYYADCVVYTQELLRAASLHTKHQISIKYNSREVSLSVGLSGPRLKYIVAVVLIL